MKVNASNPSQPKGRHSPFYRGIMFSFLLTTLAFLAPAATLAEIDPRFDVISLAQNDLLRQSLLRTEGVLTQGWGNQDPINAEATKGCRNDTLRNLHLGVDFAADLGMPIYSATAGQVVRIEEGAEGGRKCEKNPNKCLSVISVFNHVVRKTFDYLHLVPDPGLLATFRENQSLKKITVVHPGDLLGTVGARGLATGPHLHFQVKGGNVEAQKKGKARTFCIDGTFNPYEAVFPSIYVNGGTLGDGSITKIDSGTLEIETIGSGFVSPEDMTADADGRLFIVESDFATGTSKIERINPDGTGRVVIDAAICGPEGPTFSDEGHLYVNTRQFPCEHSGIWRIRRGEPGGRVTNVVPAFSDFGEGTAFLTAGPFAGDLIAVGSIIEGGFTVAAILVRSKPPSFGDAVLFVDLTGDVPVGLAVNSEGDVFVTSVFEGTVLRYSPSGVSKGVFASGLAMPHFIEFDAADNLYIAEDDSGAVSRIDPQGVKTVLATLPNAVGLAVGVTSAKFLLGLTD